MKIENIRVSESVYSEAVSRKIGVNDVMREKYHEEISALIKENPKWAEAEPVSMALAASGLTLDSPISAFYSTKENEYLFPAILETQITRAIDGSRILNLLLASTKTVPSKDVRTLVVDFSAEDAQKMLTYRDVAEGAELPRVKIGESKKAIRIYKRGLAVESTYEAIQDATINMFLETLNEAMRFSSYVQIGDVITTLVDGDGNDNAADTSATTATAGKVEPDDITDLLIDFTDESNGLSANTLLTNKAIYKQLAKMYIPTTEMVAYRPGTMFTFPQTMFDGLTVVYDKRVPKVGTKDIIIALDNQSAIDKFVVANSIINEFDRNIVSQKEIGTISERVGFGKRNKKAAKILKLK